MCYELEHGDTVVEFLAVSLRDYTTIQTLPHPPDDQLHQGPRGLHELDPVDQTPLMDRHGQCQADLGHVLHPGGYRGDSVSIETGTPVREHLKTQVNYFKYKRKGSHDTKGQDKPL